MKSVSGWIRLLGLAVAALPAIFSNTLRAQQDWPQRPVKLVLPLVAGSGADTSARFISEKLQKYLGKAVVIEPRPGGDSVVAINAVLNAGDNHTFFFGPASIFVMHPHRYAKLSYDFQRDFVPLAQVAATTVGFTVPANLPVKSLKDFIDFARANPGKVYRGAAPALNDLMASHLDGVCDTATSLASSIAGGTARGLVVASAQRLPTLPDVPTAAEGGIPEFQGEGWNALFVPRDTPAPIIARLNEALRKASEDPAYRKRLADLSAVIASGEEFEPAHVAALIPREVEKYRKLLSD